MTQYWDFHNKTRRLSVTRWRRDSIYVR